MLYETTIEIDHESTFVEYEVSVYYNFYKRVEPVLYGDYPDPGNPPFVEIVRIQWAVDGTWKEMPDAIADFIWPSNSLEIYLVKQGG